MSKVAWYIENAFTISISHNQMLIAPSFLLQYTILLYNIFYKMIQDDKLSTAQTDAELFTDESVCRVKS